MQRPRRTSEFQEEPGTSTKRQPRTTRRGVSSVEGTPAAFGTALKGVQRQRISATGSANRLRLFDGTPQKQSSLSARALFTSEKQRGAGGNVALHNDKKWVQEQAQRITEYLRNAWYPGGLVGISEDFFTRSNCLKQMSIKQFVSIINYFLQFVWGSKFKVGNNHVEDVIMILQKLKYPHQVNKSWLKTPNTTHSFGNVIVLLDFLRSFAPETQLEFPLFEPPQETTSENDIDLDLDMEFKANFLQSCEKSFPLWDKDLQNDFENVKRRTAGLLVQKRCGIADVDALDVELDCLLKKLEALQKKQPHNNAHIEEKEWECLKKCHVTTHKEIEQLCEDYKKNNLQFERILATTQHCNTEIKRLEHEVAYYQTAIHNQICSVTERDAFLTELQDLRAEVQCYERTLDDLKGRDCRQQVQLSNAKKRLTDEIEHFNAVLRDFIFTLSITESQQQLQLPLNTDLAIVQNLLPHLKDLKKLVNSEIQKTREPLNQYEAEIKKLRHELTVENEPNKKAFNGAIMSFLSKKEEFKLHMVKESEALAVQEQQLQLEINEINIESDNCQQRVQSVGNQLHQVKRECEEIITNAENEHRQAAEKREIFLNNFEDELNLCINSLHELEDKLHNKESQ